LAFPFIAGGFVAFNRAEYRRAEKNSLCDQCGSIVHGKNKSKDAPDCEPRDGAVGRRDGVVGAAPSSIVVTPLLELAIMCLIATPEGNATGAFGSYGSSLRLS